MFPGVTFVEHTSMSMEQLCEIKMFACQILYFLFVNSFKLTSSKNPQYKRLSSFFVVDSWDNCSFSQIHVHHMTTSLQRRHHLLKNWSECTAHQLMHEMLTSVVPRFNCMTACCVQKILQENGRVKLLYVSVMNVLPDVILM